MAYLTWYYCTLLGKMHKQRCRCKGNASANHSTLYRNRSCGCRLSVCYSTVHYRLVPGVAVWTSCSNLTNQVGQAC